MANNRMYIKCVHCNEAIYIAKYYPIDGFFIDREAQELKDELDLFFDKHIQCGEKASRFDNQFKLIYDYTDKNRLEDERDENTEIFRSNNEKNNIFPK
jgi:hypothetical protein